MEHFERAPVATIVRRLAEAPTRLIAVFGPRQTGKTIIVRQALRQVDLERRYLAVDAPESASLSGATDSLDAAIPVPETPDREWLVRHWEEARRVADRSPGGCVLVLDEIQKLPAWSETVKGLWDADRFRNTRLHVVILGSAPLLIQSGLSESLAGRFETIHVGHWSFAEMAAAFDFSLEEYLYFGAYPGAASLIREPERWRSYILDAIVAPNIERDILALTRVDKPALLKQTFTLGAAYSGQILAYHKMLGELRDAGNTTTLSRYLDLLSQAGLLAGLPKYASRPHRRGSSPKLNVLNTALMTAGSGYTFAEARADRSFWGRIVESAVGAHLLNTAVAATIHYWREQSNEVDFVLRRGPRLAAVEVKSGQPRTALRGMQEFERQFQPQRSLLVGEGGTPLAQFLSEPAEHWVSEGSP